MRKSGAKSEASEPGRGPKSELESQARSEHKGEADTEVTSDPGRGAKSELEIQRVCQSEPGQKQSKRRS